MSLSVFERDEPRRGRRALALGLLAAASGPLVAQASARTQGREGWREQATLALLQARLNGQADVLRGLQALVQLRPDLTRREFERTASQMDILRRHPGVREVALVRHVPQDERETFTQAARADVHLSGRVPAHFIIHPSSPEGDAYVLTQLWPSAARDAALGFELHAEPALARAYERAWRTGELVASAPWSMPDASAPVQALMLAVRDHRTAEAGQEGRLVGAVMLVFSPAQVAQTLASELGQPLNLTDEGPEGAALSAAAPMGPLTLAWATRRWRLHEPVSPLNR